MALTAILQPAEAVTETESAGGQTLAGLVRAGHPEAVLAAITSPDIDVNAAEPDGSTALLWAVHSVNHDLVRALLKAGAKPNIANHFGASPLTEAVKLGDVGIATLLLDAGADVNSPNQDNQTTLMLASSIGSRELAALLITRGADVNAVERFRNQTALMWAAAEGHADVVELLLDHGADVKPRAAYDDWPRQETSEPRAQFRQTGGLTALLYAARTGCYACAVAIVKAGADVNQPNPDGITPLIDALDNKSYDIAMLLLDHGANPQAWDMTGRTPLYVAVDQNSFYPRLGIGATAVPVPIKPSKIKAMDVVNRLLALGVNPNHQLTRMRPNGLGRGRFSEYMLRGGTTPLMVATLSYDSEALKALLTHGVEVDLPNVFQITPLMAAASMTGGGRSSITPVGGSSLPPGDIQEHAIKVIDLLLDAGANINARVEDSHTRTAKLTAYVETREHEGQTALFAASESGWDKVVRHLISRGADPSLRDVTGKTALEYAHTPGTAWPGYSAENKEAYANRVATVKYLETLTPSAAP
ncbi:MAG TPA: ankyrin repeat domain-containing protein [Steroidobacteraceae bacterium]|jgi:ankyrin repeat protein